MRDDLKATVIRENLPSQWLVDPRVTVLPSVDSTNTYAKQRLNHRPEIVVAERQTAGKGRFHHRFVSPAQSGIYLTIVWPLNDQADGGLEAARAAVAVVQAVAAVTGLELAIKWPNDLVFRHQKRGGLLIEQVQTSAGWQLLIGIGLNLAATDVPALPVSLTLADTPNQQWTRNQVIAAIYGQLTALFQQPAATWLAVYRQSVLWVGERVQFNVSGQAMIGILQGLDPHNRLQVQPQTGPLLVLEAERVSELMPLDQDYQKPNEPSNDFT